MLRKPPRKALELFMFVLYLVKYRENRFFLYWSSCRISFIYSYIEHCCSQSGTLVAE